ncbi:MAG: hypothetical protein ABIJ16_04280, partial [Bacteroidota bacterium]
MSGFSIDTEYSLWFLPLCLLLSAILVFILYRKDKKIASLKKWQLRLLYSLRFLFIFLLTILLLSPLIRHLTRIIREPVIIIAQDNSESIVMNKDSAFYKTEYLSALSDLEHKLKEKFELVKYSFEDGVNDSFVIDYMGKSTGFNALFDRILTDYSNRNIGALILATDGLYNTGKNPLTTASGAGFPVYSIALGDTSYHRDIILKEVNCNKVAFLGNKFPVQLYIEMNRLKGISSELVVYHANELVFNQKIESDRNFYSREFFIEAEANSPGLQHYKVGVRPVEGELSNKNNFAEIVIDVIDDRQKILLLFNSPHPDIAAIKSALATDLNFSFDAFNITEFRGKIEEYNLLILHQLPSVTNGANEILRQVYASGIPVLYILGPQTDVVKINNLNAGLSVSQRKNSFEESTPVLNNSFLLFDATDLTDLFSVSPPLITPFGEYKLSPGSEVLCRQQIRSIITQKPLISFYKTGDHKQAFICGEGIWRWRINDYAMNATHENFDLLINKTIQYLSLKVNKDRFILDIRNIYKETDPVVIGAEIYNENYELINDPEIIIDVYDSKGKKYPFILTKTFNAYRLDAGNFMPGDYTCKASVKIGEKNYYREGRFSVIPVQIESQKTIADHNLLFN